MKNIKLLSIIGARPQFIKHSVMQREFQNFGIKETLVHTGQHFDVSMSDVFFQKLKIRKPDVTLGISSKSPVSQLGSMLIGLDGALGNQKFDCVLVYGDTTSTLAGSLFARDRGIALAHIESGLRSGDLDMPEERNRIICDRLSNLLFAPTQEAVKNLEFEKVGGEVFLSGDVMKDAFLHFLPQAIRPKDLRIDSPFVLCTIHRQGNVDSRHRLEFLLRGLGEIGNAIVLPLHPRTQKRILEFGLDLPSNVTILPPQGYFEMLWLLEHCQCVLTDSGGLQKEAYFAQKKCLVLRDVSEWKELVECGACELLGQRDLKGAFNSLSVFCGRPDLYGDGQSVKRILEKLVLLTNGA